MLSIACTLIGFGFKIWLIAQTYMCLRTIYGPSVRFQELRFQMQKFLLYKRISKSTQERVMRFYDFLFSGNFHRKKEINALLGNELSYLVTTETCARHLQDNYFFRNLPDEHLSAIASCMSEVFFLPNDVICKVDSIRSQVRSLRRKNSSTFVIKHSREETLSDCQRYRGRVQRRRGRIYTFAWRQHIRRDSIPALRWKFCELFGWKPWIIYERSLIHSRAWITLQRKKRFCSFSLAVISWKSLPRVLISWVTCGSAWKRTAKQRRKIAISLKFEIFQSFCAFLRKK